MSRRIVFAGGSQTRALARIYRSEIAGQTGDDVVFIGTGAVGTDAARSTLLLADVLVMEIDEDGDAIPAADVPSRAELVRVPNLYADYLWPFAGSAHPKNRGQFALPGGPYPAEHGDRFLDKLVAEHVNEQDAVARYLALDIVTEGELDSRLTDRTAIQQKLDAIGGYDLTSYISDKFRSEKLFNTRQRVTLPLLRRLVDQLFGKLGVRGWQEDRLRRVPFPAGAQPVHPGVISHFGLTWANAESRYPVNEEGQFTFAEFCGRYMRFEWNETLHRGIQTAKTQPKEAIPDLEKGLAISPESPLGQKAMQVARRAAGISDAPPGLDEVIDEESYDPLGGLSVAPAPLPEQKAAAADPVEAAIEPPEAATPEQIASAPSPAAPETEAEPEAKAPDAAAEELAAEEAKADAAPLIDSEAAKPEEPPEVRVTRFPAPAKPAGDPRNGDGTVPDGHAGFTDFRPDRAGQDAILATPGDDLIEVLPRMLPVFRDFSSAVDRPFDAMPELMPPPPLRPILPPELQGEPAKQGVLAKLFGRKS
jgi:hypothetical protein